MSEKAKRVDGIYFPGGADNCVDGAYNLWKRYRGGTILQLGLHVYFFLPNAEPNARARNLGWTYDKEGKIETRQLFDPYRLQDLKDRGRPDVTHFAIAEGARNEKNKKKSGKK